LTDKLKAPQMTEKVFLYLTGITRELRKNSPRQTRTSVQGNPTRHRRTDNKTRSGDVDHCQGQEHQTKTHKDDNR
jgi:hypothetical protein